MAADHTVVIVLYATDVLDLRALPPGTPVVLVHNDDRLHTIHDRGLRFSHVHTGGNVGFGAGVNAGLRAVATPRVLLCNPDVQLETGHWRALTAPSRSDEIVTLPQVDAQGAPGSTVNRYPGPLTTLLQLLEVGRWAPRGSTRRDVLTRALGDYGTAHRRSLAGPGAVEGRFPLSRYWVSASLLSCDTMRLRSIGGFDPGYFLYVEDVDLCRRLAAAHPDTEVVVRSGAAPVLHTVGGSASDPHVRRLVRRTKLRSAHRYARASRGTGWTLLHFALSCVLLAVSGGRS